MTSTKMQTRRLLTILCALAALALAAAPALCGEYSALEKVEGLDTVFDFTHGTPKSANLIFWAVRDVHQNAAVGALPNPPRTVVVFHGPAVKLISTEREGFQPDELGEVEKFADTIRQMKKEGVTFEVCLYAAKVFGIEPSTILPEIDGVGNGFISVAGYQQQGYGLVAIP